MLLFNLFIILISNGLTIRKDVSIFYSRIAIIILIYSIISTFEGYYIIYIGKGIGLYNGLFNATTITQTFQGFIFISTATILFLTSFYPRKSCGDATEKKNLTNQISLIINKMAEQYSIIEYALIILFVILGGTLLFSSGDNVSLFLCIELQSYGLYIICVVYRDSESATSSGLTYFLLGGLSSCFILLGIAFIYVNTGVTSLDSFYVITNLSKYIEFTGYFYNTQFLTYSLLIMSVGLLFKIGAAPFHFWSPDVYDGIPTTVTTFVANIAKITILVLTLEIVHYTSETIKISFNWTTGILVSCMLCLVIGTVLGLSQTRIKRLLAYSTISHIGFILLALCVNSIESNKAFIFYLMQYIITNINTFILLITLGITLYIYILNKNKDGNSNSYNEAKTWGTGTGTTLFPEKSTFNEEISSSIQLINQMKGYFYINPLLSLSLAVVILSFIGLPPLIGFFAKQTVLYSALDNGFIFLVLISVIASVVGTVYYLGVVKNLFFEKSDYELLKLRLNSVLSNNLSILVSITTIFVLLYILYANESVYLSGIVSSLSFSDKIDLETVYNINVRFSPDNLLKISFNGPSINLEFDISSWFTNTETNVETSSSIIETSSSNIEASYPTNTSAEGTSSIPPFKSKPTFMNTLGRDWITEVIHKPEQIVQYKGWTPTPHPIKPYSYLDIGIKVGGSLKSMLPEVDIEGWGLDNILNSFNINYFDNMINHSAADFLINPITVFALPQILVDGINSSNYDIMIDHFRLFLENYNGTVSTDFLHFIKLLIQNAPDDIWSDLIPIISSYDGNTSAIYNAIGSNMAEQGDEHLSRTIMGLLGDDRESIRSILTGITRYVSTLMRDLSEMGLNIVETFISQVRSDYQPDFYNWQSVGGHYFNFFPESYRSNIDYFVRRTIDYNNIIQILLNSREQFNLTMQDIIDEFGLYFEYEVGIFFSVVFGHFYEIPSEWINPFISVSIEAIEYFNERYPDAPPLMQVMFEPEDWFVEFIEHL